MVCDDVTYEGTHRKTGKSIRLSGRDMIRYCPGDHGDGEGKTPCRHVGYEFRNGNIEYNVWNDGRLEVWREFGKRHADGTRERQLIVDEKGTWSWTQ
jgi:hypothetical protein